jgi:THAP4-like, heme-binding beta-barrel domain
MSSAESALTQPVPDTTDVRSGVPLNDQLLALLPLVGVWIGTGTGAVASSGAEFTFGQRITFAHDGRPFLAYESRTWLVDAAGDTIRQAFRESGFWRPGAGPDDVEVQLATAAGIVEVFAGTAGDNRWELATTGLAATATARAVAGERRLYAVVGNTLAYATELGLPKQDFVPHLSGHLKRA